MIPRLYLTQSKVRVKLLLPRWLKSKLAMSCYNGQRRVRALDVGGLQGWEWICTRRLPKELCWFRLSPSQSSMTGRLEAALLSVEKSCHSSPPSPALCSSFFFQSCPFLSHGLSYQPLLLQPPPTLPLLPPPEGRLNGFLVACFRGTIPVSTTVCWNCFKKGLGSTDWGVWRWQGLHRVWSCLCCRLRCRIKTWGPYFSRLYPSRRSTFPSAFSSRHELSLLQHLTTRSMQMPWLQHLYPLYKHWTAAAVLATLLMSPLGLSQWSILWLEILFFPGTTSRLFHH